MDFDKEEDDIVASRSIWRNKCFKYSIKIKTAMSDGETLVTSQISKVFITTYRN